MKTIPRSSWREVPVPVFTEDLPVWTSADSSDSSVCLRRKTFSRERPREQGSVREYLDVSSFSDGALRNFTHRVLTSDTTVDFTRSHTYDPSPSHQPSWYSEKYRSALDSEPQLSTRMAVPSKPLGGRSRSRLFPKLKGDLTCVCYHSMTGSNSKDSLRSHWGMLLASGSKIDNLTTVFVGNLEFLS